jgi:hypothetical protein
MSFTCNVLYVFNFIPIIDMNLQGNITMQLTHQEIEQEKFEHLQMTSGEQAPSKIRLFYRGNIFDYAPPARVEPEESAVDWPIATLSYRGQSYTRKIKPPQPYQKPRAINWRWQFS